MIFISNYQWKVDVGSYNHYIIAWAEVYGLLGYDEDRFEKFVDWLHDQAVLDGILMKYYGIKGTDIPTLVQSLKDYNQYLKDTHEILLVETARQREIKRELEIHFENLKELSESMG